MLNMSTRSYLSILVHKLSLNNTDLKPRVSVRECWRASKYVILELFKFYTMLERIVHISQAYLRIYHAGV